MARSDLGSGATLALLLLGGFRSLVDAAVVELERRGYRDVRPAHDLAMRAIEAGADSATTLARRLGVTKQAAAKTIAVLEQRGYVARGEDPHDARRRQLEVTALGLKVLREGESILEELRGRWARRIGPRALRTLEKQLAMLAAPSPQRLNPSGDPHASARDQRLRRGSERLHVRRIG